MSDYYQPTPSRNNGLLLALILMLGAFLTLAVQQHWISDAFVWLMSQFFTGFSIHIASHLSDVVLLIAFALMLFGLYCFVKFFFPLFIGLTVVFILGAVFLTLDDDPLKPVKLQSETQQEKSQKHFANYGG